MLLALALVGAMVGFLLSNLALGLRPARRGVVGYRRNGHLAWAGRVGVEAYVNQ